MINNTFMRVISGGAIKIHSTDILSKLFYALSYNTTFIVNIMLMMGVVSPFAMIQAIHHNLSAKDLLIAISIMFITTYCYNLIYIVNDIIDRKKDTAKAIPKFTASHIIGRRYLGVVLACFATVVLCFGLVVSQLFVPLGLYSLLLISLSVVHSISHSTKLVTIFLERFIKFIAPLSMVYLGTGNTTVLPMILGTLLLFPLSHTMDYAYRGYISDRLHGNKAKRFIVYGVYYLAVIVLFAYIASRQPIGIDVLPIMTFIGLYGLVSIISDMLAKLLPLGFLDNRYVPHVAGEKRRLLAYGFIQVLILLIGGIYAINS